MHGILTNDNGWLGPLVIGASLSEPHIDEFAVNFPYISLYLSYVVL